MSFLLNSIKLKTEVYVALNKDEDFFTDKLKINPLNYIKCKILNRFLDNKKNTKISIFISVDPNS